MLVDTPQTLVAMVRLGVGVGIANAVALDHTDTAGLVVLDSTIRTWSGRSPSTGTTSWPTTEVGASLLRALRAAPVPPGATAPTRRRPRTGGESPAGGGRVGSPIRAGADPGSRAPRAEEAMAPFVGRQPELAVLRARLAEALAGQPQVVQIQGPAGIGKTALIEHFLRDPG